MTVFICPYVTELPKTRYFPKTVEDFVPDRQYCYILNDTLTKFITLGFKGNVHSPGGCNEKIHSKIILTKLG